MQKTFIMLVSKFVYICFWYFSSIQFYITQYNLFFSTRLIKVLYLNQKMIKKIQNYFKNLKYVIQCYFDVFSLTIFCAFCPALGCLPHENAVERGHRGGEKDQ